ncbi:MAG TPA: PAS domain-containing protein [Gaiellaceae bacterium]|nr:PAS domain-containing protein [Gaiellaceae bacterium]
MRNRILAVLTLAIAATAGALYLAFTSDHEENPAFVTAVYLVIVWSFIGTGLFAWARRPDNRFGPLMASVGFAFMLGSLSESNDANVFAVGAIVGGLGIAVFVHALLAFPRGYLETRLVFALVATAYFVVVGVQALYNAFNPETCDGCPRNAILVTDSEAARTALGVVAVIGAAFVLVGTAAVLARRWRAASPPLRRTLAPIFATSAATLSLLALAIAVSFVSNQASDVIWWFVLASFATVPLAFLAGLLQIRLARASVATLVVELLSADGLEELQDAIAGTLGDPELELAVWLPETFEWIGADGGAFDLAAASDREGRATTFVEHEGEVVATLVHDAALEEERDLVDAVGAAAGLALAREGTVEALRRSEGRYRALLDAAPDLMFRFDREGTYLDFNGHPEDLVTPPESLLGSRAHDILPQETADHIVNGVREAIDTGRLVTGDYRVTIDGVERDFEARIVKDGDEAIVIAREFTELKRLNLQLERERDYIRTVVDNAPSLFCMVDLEGRILRFNQTLELLAGVADGADARGQPFWEVFIVPDEADEVSRELMSLAAEGAAGEHENRWRAAGGGEAVVAWSTTPLLDEHGRPSFLISGSDITERKEHEEELRRSRTRLIEAGDAERRRLERNLHDGAQQRLVSLSLAMRLAQAKLKTDPAEAGKLLDSASEELAQALEELRELARGIHPAILSDRGLPAALEALAGRAPLPVDISALDERLPPPVEAAAYYVVSEALTNVAKYAQASAVDVRVTRLNGRAVVEVADDGIGGADPLAGSGLRGLADRVEALDGRLHVESAPGRGTMIRAEIPCG